MRIIGTTVLAILAISASAQIKGTKNAKGEYPQENLSTNLLPIKAFNKMIIEDITYAIVGESSPVSGLKIDITKPEATISGVFQPKKKPSILVGLEFKGGITDKSFSIFKGNDFNTSFEGKPSIHYIPAWNKARYFTANKPILLTKNDLVTARTKLVEDSFHMVTLIYNEYAKNIPEVLDKTALPTDATIGTTGKDLLIWFIKKFTGSNNAVLVNTSSLATLLGVVTPAVIAAGQVTQVTYNEDILSAYDKYKKLFDEKNEQEMTIQISNVSKAWSRKKYWWFTFSPVLRAEKITGYHTKFQGLDSQYFKADYTFYYGISAMLNRYTVWPKKLAIFWRAGINLSRANNLSSLNSFNYETRKPFFSSGNNVTEKIKTGTAYTFDEVQSGFAGQLTGEMYILPLKTFIPGFYVTGTISESRLYRLPEVVGRANDKILIPLEGGVVFNINSREKDKEKSILSISFYSRHEDITDKRRTATKDLKEETRDEFRKRNFTLGIKVGIPITLPQKAD